MSTPTLTPLRGPILKAGLDLSYCDSYPLFRARDGLQLMEDGTVGATDYVGLYAPAAITASYGLTFPGTGPSESSYFEVSAAGAISWAHVADLGSTHDHDAAYISIIGAPAANHFPYQTAGGELIDSGYAAGDFLTSVTAHDILSVTHGDAAAAAVVRGDIITGQGANPNTKWTRLALGAAGTYLAGSATEPVWATLNQAAIAGLTTGDGPTFDHLHITNGAIFGDQPRTATSLYRRYYHIPLGSSNPGASGATWVDGTADTIGGWQLNAVGETVRGGVDVHSDWDGASDMKIEVRFQVNVNNTGGGAGDTVDLKIVARYMGLTDVAVKTQTVEVATIVGASAQFKTFNADFTLNWDEVSNVIEAGDHLTFKLNLETDTSEVDDVIISGMSFSYLTTHMGIEDGDE